MKTPLCETEEFERLSKLDVRALANDLTLGEPTVVERCVRFVCAETEGLWHGRGRAMMCRRLKHIRLSRSHRTRLLNRILSRLATGSFSEQFRDQLRLALHIDRKKTVEEAQRSLGSDKDYVQRHARWILSRPIAQDDA